MNILIVEDIEYKREKVISSLFNMSSRIVIDVAKSFSSAVNLANDNKYELIILDMSIPTYDKGPNENGGRFRVYGGKDIIRKLLRKNDIPRIVILTQHTTFGEVGDQKTTDTLSEEIEALIGDKFLGIIKYDSTKPQWKEELNKIVQGLI
ncbi:hypothetical protein [Pantoea sp. ANP04]|uniref:hypothetical protein n=1 Tax=Pantoea TaxID=53335 RepID=UPI0035C629D4